MIPAGFRPFGAEIGLFALNADTLFRGIEEPITGVY
jgi:hypothetical protein